jgi:hypothetical protein
LLATTCNSTEKDLFFSILSSDFGKALHALLRFIKVEKS